LGEYRELGKTDIPVRILWGRQDLTTPLEHSEKLLELIAQAQRSIIEDAGHLPQLEQPGVVNKLLIEYLQP